MFQRKWTLLKNNKLKNFRLNYSVHAILTFVTNNICPKATLKCNSLMKLEAEQISNILGHSCLKFFQFQLLKLIDPLPKINNHHTYFAAFILVKLLHFLTKLLVNVYNLPPETNLYVLVWREQIWFCFHILLKKEIIEMTLKT